MSEKMRSDVMLGGQKRIFSLKYHVTRHKITQNTHRHSSRKQLQKIKHSQTWLY
jgi:hypothetical protein